MFFQKLLKTFSRFPSPLAPLRFKDRITIRGLKHRVIVYFDTAGIPHIVARNPYDLFFTQGYVTARDRLWQMDFLRRAISGRLSEILGDTPVDYKTTSVLFKGKTTVDMDYFTRLFDLRKSAARSLARLSAEAFDALTAYSDGVNAYIMNESLPPEFLFLRYKPEPWSPLDSLTILRGIGLELNVSWRSVLFNQFLANKFPDNQELRELFPSYIRNDLTTARFNADEAAAPEDLLKLDDWLRLFSSKNGSHLGSNAWAVSGKITATGKPMLCNDPHLSMYSPSPWYATHLSGGGYEAAGVTPAGIPFISIGHNRRIAWGITAAMMHDTDCFIEEIDPLNPNNYFHFDKSIPFQIFPQKIVVKDRVTPVERNIRHSRNGPIISDILNGKPNERFVYAMRWTGHEGSREIDAILGINRASDFKSFREACKMSGVPGFNLIYADIEGNIGYQLAALAPIRKKGKNNLPVPARYDEYKWEGYVPFEKLPCLYNPKSQFTANANNKIADDAYPYFLSDFWEPYYRFERLSQLLSNRRNLTLQDMINIQNDLFSGWARGVIEDLIRPWLVEGGAAANFDLEAAAQELVTWDGVARPMSNSAAIFYLFYHELMKAVFKEKLGDELFESYFEVFNNSIMPLENIIASKTTGWFPPLDRSRIITHSLEETIKKLTIKFGHRIEDWQWGKMHELYMRHRLHSHPFFAKHFSIGPFQTGGDGMTINNGHFSFNAPFNHLVGATMRLICDLGNWDNTLIVLNTGQSGHPFSPRYKDHAEKWAKGEYFRFPFEAGTVERYPRMILDPQRKLF